jgi:hypothetical protein
MLVPRNEEEYNEWKTRSNNICRKLRKLKKLKNATAVFRSYEHKFLDLNKEETFFKGLIKNHIK